jgi:quinol monooxygenase YgiN
MKTLKKFKNSAIIIALAFLSITGIAQNGNGKIYLSISHEVKDYALWEPGFDQHISVRKEAGLKDLFVKQDVNNTNSITAFFEVTDLDKANAFLADPELKEAMTKSGVTSAPEIVFYKSAVEFDPINTTGLVVTVSHSVKDFAAWKKVYESAGEVHENPGMHDNLVLRSLSDENTVTVLGSSSSLANFNAYMANPNLKEAMEKAGVISKPEVKVLF